MTDTKTRQTMDELIERIDSLGRSPKIDLTEAYLEYFYTMNKVDKSKYMIPIKKEDNPDIIRIYDTRFYPDYGRDN